MARTAFTPVAVPTRQSVVVSADAADLAWEAIDTVNGNDFVCTGKELILVWNQNGSAQTVTVDAPPDEFARDGAITDYSVDPDEIARFGLLHADGWKQTDGKIHVAGSHADLKVAVLRFT